MNRFWDRMIWSYKKITDCAAFAVSRGDSQHDFENAVNRGSAVNFGAESYCACLTVCTLGPKRNLDH